MKKITFREVRYKNLLATGNVHTVVRLDRSRTTLVTGRNGAGKSTVLEAICFALFNKPYRAVTKPKLVNTINNKNCEVELDFDIGTTKYTIRRGIKPDVFQIIVDGQPMDEDSASRDQQAYLEEVILQLTYKTFVKIAIVGTATYKPFMAFTAAERRSMIDELLDVGVYTQMAKVLKLRADSTKQKLKDLQAELDLQVDKIDLQKRYIQTLHDDRSAKIAANREKIDTALSQIEDEQLLLDGLTARREELVASVGDSVALDEKYDQLRQLRRKLSDNSTTLANEIAFFEEHDDCPVCKQTITKDFRTDAIQTKTTKRETLVSGLAKMETQMISLKQQIDGIAEVNRQISGIDGKIREVNSNIRTEQQYVAKLQKDIAAEEATPTADITGEKKKLQELAKKAITLTSDRDTEAQQKLYYDMIAVMLKDSGIKAKVIEQYLPVINALINEYLQELDFFVGFELDESFSETIRSRGRDIFAYESFSEGEKKKIDTAILFTWVTLGRLKNTVSTNLLFFDEMFDSALDQDSVNAVVAILDEMSQDDTNIFVISHHPEAFETKFHAHLKFSKVNNYSVLM